MSLKEKIIKDLESGIVPGYRRYGVSREEFLETLKEMEQEKTIFVEWLKTKLPDGTPHPHQGDPKYIRLRK